MENPNLFHEVLDISSPQEVKAAYEYAVTNNIKYYRAISKANHVIYGLDTRNGQYIPLDSAVKNFPQSIEKIGDAYWFVNDKYVAEKKAETAPVETVYVAADKEIKVESTSPVSAPATATVADDEKEEDTPYVPDYKTMHERLRIKYRELLKKYNDKADFERLFNDARGALTAKTEEYNVLKLNYLKVREAQTKTISTLQEIEESVQEIDSFLKDIDGDLTTIKTLNLE